MKKLLLFSLIFSTCHSLSHSQEAPPKIVKMGLVAELMSIKLNAETQASMVFSDTISINVKDQRDVLESYNRLRILSIPLIAQLIADLSSKNNIRLYKKLDELLVGNKIEDVDITKINDEKLRSYIENLKNLNTAFVEFYNLAFHTSHRKGGNPKMPAVTDFIGIFTAIQTAVKDLNEAKGKKVDKLVVILDALKLADPSDLQKGEVTKSAATKDKKSS